METKIEKKRAVIKSYIIKDARVIEQNDKSKIEFENVGYADVVIDGIIPLPVGTKRTFEVNHNFKIDNDFILSNPTNADISILVLETTYH